MPRLVEMPAFHGTLAGKPVKVPGGWFARVPEVREVDAETRQADVAYFQASGLSPMKAEEAAQEMWQAALETSYKKYLGDAIRRYAKVYARRYPHLWDRATGELKGFDPARMALSTRPWEKATRRRKGISKTLMGEMAMSARGAYAEI
jgi:hypothetical protein